MKITLITGASSGLGLELARIYAKNNNNLLLVARSEDKLINIKKEIEQEYNVFVDYKVIDVSKKEELSNLYQYTKEKDYFINNLVNNAGFGDRGDFIDMDIDKQMQMTDVNCNAVLYLTKVFLNNMLLNNEGHIINVCSIAAFMPAPYMCTYHATKAFVLYLGEAISYEIRKSNVKLLTLCPGPFTSNFVNLAHNDYTFKKIKPISALKVANFAYKKSIKGKKLAIVGFKNKLTVFACRFFPRSFVTMISAKNIKK